MKILAIETTSSACSVAISLDNNVIDTIHRIAPMQQTGLLLPMIEEILHKNQLSLNQLEAIAFGAGPGSFTGMRIASSVAQGLAFSANLPIIKVSSLAALALAAHATLQKPAYLVALDARMGQVYWAHYEVYATDQLTLQGEEKLCKPDEIPTLNAILPDCAGIGEGWAVYAAILEQTLGFKPNLIDSSALPTAEAVLRLALAKPHKETAAAALPHYLTK